MVGCPHGAKNTLVKNYLWFAEREGVEVMPERTVTDIKPLGGRRQRWLRGHDRALGRVAAQAAAARITARGVVVAAGALGTNRLLAACKLNGSLPQHLATASASWCARTPRRSSPSRCPTARRT